MANDAKLGLLAGVIGVIAVAVLSMNRPTPVAHAPTAPTPIAHAPGSPDHEVAGRAEPASTPIPRTRKEPDGTPAGRTPMDDIDP